MYAHMHRSVNLGACCPLCVSYLARQAFRGTAFRPHKRQPNMRGKAPKATQTGHQVPNTSVVSEEAQDPEILAFQEHQASAARLSHAEEASTLMAVGKVGVLSTNSSGEATQGYPSGSVVEYAADEAGWPLFAFSLMSAHTSDVRRDGRISLTVTAPSFQGMSDARFTMIGDIAPVPEADKEGVRSAYLARNPGSFWVDFGDFTLFRMTRMVTGRLIGGFARAGQVTPEEYAAAAPDPVFEFSQPVAGHMNADHAEATAAIVKSVTGMGVDSAKILTVDRLGMNVQCSREGQTFKCRVPFTRPATDRKAIKDVIVEMTRAAASAKEAVAA